MSSFNGDKKQKTQKVSFVRLIPKILLIYLPQDFVDDLVELLLLEFVLAPQELLFELVLAFVLADLLALAIFTS